MKKYIKYMNTEVAPAVEANENKTSQKNKEAETVVQKQGHVHDSK